MKQESLARGVQLGREEGMQPDKLGKMCQVAELEGMGREQSPMAYGGSMYVLDPLRREGSGETLQQPSSI